MNLRILTVASLVCVALLGMSSVASAQGLDEQLRSLEAKLKATRKNLAELQNKLEHARKRIRKLETEVLELAAENAQLKKRLAKTTHTPRLTPVLEPAVEPAVPAAVDPMMTTVKDRKHREAITATPVRFNNFLLGKATAMGLTTGKLDEKRRKAAQADLNRWAATEKLIGIRVAWTVRVDAADDTFSDQQIALLSEQLAQDRLSLTRYQRDRDSILGGTADPVIYRTLGKQKTLTKLRSEIARLRKRVPERTRELWDAKIYTVRARLSVPGRDDVAIRADFHKEDKDALQALDRNRGVIVAGTVRRIRCDVTEAGKAVFPIELGRCRLAGE